MEEAKKAIDELDVDKDGKVSYQIGQQKPPVFVGLKNCGDDGDCRCGEMSRSRQPLPQDFQIFPGCCGQFIGATS